MVGQWTVTKPSRSDEVLDANQQLQIANQIRAQFDSLSPNRPTKPNRSEPDESLPTPSLSTPTGDEENGIPELHKLRSLQSQSPAGFSVGGGADMVQDEFVETQYYKELDSIDKQHHTTGSGFIGAVREEHGSHGYDEIQLQRHNNGSPATASAYRSNPATNDWVPNLEDDQVFVSCKPNRSESS